MEYLFFLAILGINFWISWSNAKAVGCYWSESKEVGGSFRRLVVCGYIMAIAGFTMVYADVLIILAPFLLGSKLSSSEILYLQQMAADISYLLVGTMAVFSGFRITVNSLKNAWRERTFGYIANAGWNTFAQIRNTLSFAREAPSVAGRIVGGLFKGNDDDDGKARLAILALLLVALALMSGFLTANAIMKRADAEYDGFAEAYDLYQQQLEEGQKQLQ